MICLTSITLALKLENIFEKIWDLETLK